MTGYITDEAFKQLNKELALKGHSPIVSNVQLSGKERNLALGMIGEKLVRWYLTEYFGKKINDSYNPMDRIQDFWFDDGTNVEVKTQTPFLNLESFTTRINQMNKMKNVSFVYFLETPRKTDVLKWDNNTRSRMVESTNPDDKKASDYVSSIYMWQNTPEVKITDVMLHKKVFDNTGAMRDMVVIPYNALTKTYDITLPKHLVLLDRFSISPIGLTDVE